MNGRRVRFAAYDALSLQLLCQRLHRQFLAGNDAAGGRVDRRHPQVLPQPGTHLLDGSQDGEHRAPLALLHEPAACRDRCCRVCGREHASHAGRHVLPDAVADHGRRAYAPRQQGAGQGVLDRKDRRLSDPGHLQSGRGLLRIAVFGREEELTQVLI